MKPETQTKAELRAERDHWRELAEKGIDPLLTDLRLESGELSMALAGPAIERIAVLFIEYFRGLGAQNYVEFNIHDRVDPFTRYTLTMQKVGALSPADKVRLLTEGLIEAEAHIAKTSGGGMTEFRAHLNDILARTGAKQQATTST